VEQRVVESAGVANGASAEI